MSTTRRRHIVLAPSPGMGHLIPALELGTRLASDHGFHVTFFVMVESNSPFSAVSQVVQSANDPPLLDVVELPPVDVSDKIEPNAPHFPRLRAVMRETKASITLAISKLEPKPTAIIVDLFGTALLEVADEFKILKYVFILSGAWPLALMLYVPILDSEVAGEFTEPIRVPGCPSVWPEDLVNPMMNRSKFEYRAFMGTAREITYSDGILVNTWEDLEPLPMKAFKEEPAFTESVKVPPIYAVGPLVRPVKEVSQSTDWLAWLDSQPAESVVYIAFGSVGLLSAEQITELAWGLELSKHRFLWLIRLPMNRDKGEDLENYLPEGFSHRTQDVGRVVPSWAPQSAILGHRSVGAHMSHCGWSSALETIMNCVPAITMPLVAESRMNAVTLTEEMRVGVRPSFWPTQRLVGREEIEKMVRKVMEVEERKAMKQRLKEFKCSGENALAEGGSSYNALSRLGLQQRDANMREGQKTD